jgi:hypothetical protein
MLEEQKTQYYKGLGNTSKRFRTLFLLKITKELMKNSKVEEFFELNNVLKKSIKKSKKINIKSKQFFKDNAPNIPSMMYQQPKYKPQQIQYQQPMQQFQQNRPQIRPQQPIPEHQLPENLRYIQPTPTNMQIDLGKLNMLIQNPNIFSIECNGPDESLIIKESGITKPTNMALSKEEINQVLKKFSEITHVPLEEGVTKMVAGRLILSAIVSDIVGSRFIIRKMSQPLQRFY